MPLLIIVLLFIILTDGSDNKSHSPEKVKPKAVSAYEMKNPRHGGVAGGWYNSVCTGNYYGCNKGGF